MTKMVSFMLCVFYHNKNFFKSKCDLVSIFSIPCKGPIVLRIKFQLHSLVPKAVYDQAPHPLHRPHVILLPTSILYSTH